MPGTRSLSVMSNDKPGNATAAHATPAGELKEWSTTKELCAWLGIEKAHLYYLNARGEGPRRYRLGKAHRYRRGDVEKWLETRAVD